MDKANRCGQLSRGAYHEFVALPHYRRVTRKQRRRVSHFDPVSALLRYD
jgi:hypothetical protein